MGLYLGISIVTVFEVTKLLVNVCGLCFTMANHESVITDFRLVDSSNAVQGRVRGPTGDKMLQRVVLLYIYFILFLSQNSNLKLLKYVHCKIRKVDF